MTRCIECDIFSVWRERWPRSIETLGHMSQSPPCLGGERLNPDVVLLDEDNLLFVRGEREAGNALKTSERRRLRRRDGYAPELTAFGEDDRLRGGPLKVAYV